MTMMMMMMMMMMRGGGGGGGGGTPDLRRQGRTNGGKNQNPKKSLGASNKIKKNPWTKI